MKKSLWIFLAVLPLFWPTALLAKTKYIYKQPNNPANYIKLEKLDTKGVKANQPYTFSEDQLADILRSIRFNRKALFSEDVKTRNVFEEEYIEKFTPLLVKAFREAGPEQQVYFSVVQKRPYFIIRNDRLTQVAMWVTGRELHLNFVKTEAKLQGDYQANTQAGRKQIQDAVGLRISLEPQEGQKFSLDSAEEIILDLDRDWEAIVVQIEAEEERIKKEKELGRKRGSKKREYSQSEAAATPVSSKDQKTAEDRLTELKKLKDKGLISDEDYEKKKQEILKNL